MAVEIWTEVTEVDIVLMYGIGPSNRKAMANKKLPMTETDVDLSNLLLICDNKNSQCYKTLLEKKP